MQPQSLLFYYLKKSLWGFALSVALLNIVLYSDFQISTKYFYFINLILGLILILWHLLIYQNIKNKIQETHRKIETYSTQSNINIPSPSEIKELHDIELFFSDYENKTTQRLLLLGSQITKYEQLIGQMVEGVIALNTIDQIILINSSACRMLNIPNNSYTDLPIIELIRSGPLMQTIQTAREFFGYKDRSLPDSAALQGLPVFEQNLNLRQYFTEKSIETNEINSTTFNDRYIRFQATPFTDTKVEKGLLIVLYDYTHIQQLQTIQKEFVANVSHELKSPITAIQGFIETALNSDFKNIEEIKNFLNIALRNSIRLNHIIENLLLLSRIESDHKSISKKTTNLYDTINKALTNCAIIIKENNFSVSIECPENFSLNINPLLIENGLTNLIENAVKYCKQDKRIKIRLETNEQTCTIHVQDWGPGIPYKDQTRIFERFYRLDKARSRNMGGTGLGLAIVKHIAESHGGQVTVFSEPGRGSTFSIELPIN